MLERSLIEPPLSPDATSPSDVLVDIKDLTPPSHLAHLGSPNYSWTGYTPPPLSSLCPTALDPFEQSLLSSRPRLSGVRLVRFDNELGSPLYGEAARVALRKERSVGAPIVGTVRRRGIVLQAYEHDRPNDEREAVKLGDEEGWILVAYRGKLGFARAQSFRRVNSCRKYELFEGRNFFFDNGRYMIGPDLPSFRWSNVLLVAPVVVFYVLVAPSITPASTAGPWIGVITVLFLTALYNLYATAFTDPGILPPRLPPEPNVVPPPVVSALSSPPPVSASGHPLLENTDTRSAPGGYRYCRTCRIYRPPRSKHCSTCDNCVMDFDHHCPWTSNCVGRNNYLNFTSFVIATSLLAVCMLAACVQRLVASSSAFIAGVKLAAGDSSPPPSGADVLNHLGRTDGGSIAVALEAFFAIFAVGGLAVYHTYLIAVGQTTNENLIGAGGGEGRGGQRNPTGSGGEEGGVVQNCVRHWRRDRRDCGEGRVEDENLGDMSRGVYFEGGVQSDTANGVSLERVSQMGESSPMKRAATDDAVNSAV